MAIKTAKPSDFTGRQREEAAAAAADELAKREGQITMMQQVEVEQKENEIFDPKSGGSLGEIASVKVDPKKKEVVIQVVEDIDNMTYGAGSHFTFKVGQKYKVTENIAKHLDDLGLLWGGYK